MALIHCNFFSSTLGLSSSMDLILPEVQSSAQIGLKNRRSSGKPPVLYLLHGHSDDHTIWQRRTSIERYVAPLGIAVVMPAVNKSYYTDMIAGDKYWTFVSEELPKLVSTLFNVSERREDTFVAGLSMGGYGAFKLALRQPERFAAAASLSGVLDLAGLVKRMDDNGGKYTNIFGKSPKISGTENDLLLLSKKLASGKGKKPKLYFCCGTEDFLYQDNLKFKAHLSKLGIPFTYQEGPGNHEWGYWDANIQKVLAWLPLKANKR